MIIQSTFLSFVSEKIEKKNKKKNKQKKQKKKKKKNKKKKKTTTKNKKKKKKKNYFSVNLKFLTDVLSNSLKLKLFYILIHPILTYGSERRINDFTIKDKSLDTLSFEKKNTWKFCKFLLGTHKISSSLLPDLNKEEKEYLTLLPARHWNSVSI